MNYSNSFIPKLPSRYTLDKATMTESLIELQPGGSVSIRLSAEDIQTAPENMRLTIMADKYTDAYNPEAFVDIQITNTNVSYRFLSSIVDTNNGFYITELALDSKEAYTDFVFTIRSTYTMKILGWELAGPASTSEEYIEEMRKELPRLLKDYNEMPLIIGQEETTVCLISAFLVKNTDLNGHLQVSYRATEDCQVIMRAKDNDVTELFSPVVIDIKAGRGSIDIPHAYVEKFIGYHTFTCTLQVTNGTLKIQTRAVLYTVDGGHLAERVMDVGMDIRDIVMRRVVTDNDPSYIYAIGVDDNIITVKARPYNEVANTAWEPMLLVGEGKEAAITFNGDWAQDENGWRLNTDDEPWIFWIDYENILWAQYFDDVTTKLQLATDVIDVSVVMGWRNPTEITQDQGIIAAYIKSDGTVYYRNYCIFDQSTKVWNYERGIVQFEGLATSVYVFRTNDYRVGLRIQDASEGSTVLLSERNWAGMASPAESITGELVNLNFDVTGIKTHLVGIGSEKVSDEDIVGAVMQNYIHEPEQLSSAVGRLKMYVCPPIISPLPDIVSVERLGYTDRQTISITFNYPLECDLDNLKSRFSLKTQSNTIIDIDSVTQNGNTLFIKTIEPMKLMDNLMLTFYDIGSYFLAVRIDETCVIDYGKHIELSILGSPPEVQDNVTVFMDVMFNVIELGTIENTSEENLTGSVANLNFTVTEVDTRYGMVEEKLTSIVANIVFTVTQTSTSPI